MKIRTLSILIVLVSLVCSCSNSKKTTKSASPYLTEENSKTEVTVRTERVKPVDVSDKTLYRYYVIIGSFKQVDNARQFKSDLTKEGFTPVILENENGLFRVSVGAFNEESSARSKIAKIRADSNKYDDVWLLVRK